MTASIHTLAVLICFLVPAMQPAAAQMVAAGDLHTLVACGDGQAAACGYNWIGQLGNGSLTTAHTLTAVTGVADVASVYAGRDCSLFLLQNGAVMGVGSNLYGQLGIGTNESVSTAVLMNGVNDVVAVAAGGYHSVVLRSNGTVWSCGNNGFGQLGYTGGDQNTLQQIGGLADVIAVAAGDLNSAFVKADGTVWACGDNTLGQLGDDTGMGSSVPVQIGGLSNVVAIASQASAAYFLFLKVDGTVWACGQNDASQCGRPGPDPQTTPLQVPGIDDVVKIATGAQHSLFLRSDGTVWSCGWNLYGQLGRSAPINAPDVAEIPGLVNVTGMAGAYGHSIFATNDSIVGCGRNGTGELGTGFSSAYHPVPVRMVDACGVRHSVVDRASLSNGPGFLVFATADGLQLKFDRPLSSPAKVFVHGADGRLYLEADLLMEHDTREGHVYMSDNEGGVMLVTVRSATVSGTRRMMR